MSEEAWRIMSALIIPFLAQRRSMQTAIPLGWTVTVKQIYGDFFRIGSAFFQIYNDFFWVYFQIFWTYGDFPHGGTMWVSVSIPWLQPFRLVWRCIYLWSRLKISGSFELFSSRALCLELSSSIRIVLLFLGVPRELFSFFHSYPWVLFRLWEAYF